MMPVRLVLAIVFCLSSWLVSPLAMALDHNAGSVEGPPGLMGDLARSVVQGSPSPNGGPQDASLGRQLTNLRGFRDAASGRDRETLDRMVKILELLVAQPPGTAADARAAIVEFADSLREAAAQHPEVFELQFLAADLVWGMVVEASWLDMDPGPLRDEYLVRCRDLVARFPSEARAESVLAFALRNRDATESLRHYKRCLEIDPTHETCREGHASLARQYQRPRCAGAEMKRSLALIAATTSGADRCHDWRDRRLCLDGSPVLGVNDMAFVALGESSVIIGTVENKQPALVLGLTPTGQVKLKTATEALRREERWLALVVDDRLMQAVPVRFVIDSPEVQLTGGGSRDLGPYCEAVESPEPPLELRLPELPRGR